ncbi:MAG: hypothetical protein HFE84_12180 [Lachnospiraceae bacterium]|nr:hypothetical protein [Lachnospiraceae bacterium]
MSTKKICILGTGSGAMAVSGFLAHKGFDVSLWDDGDFTDNIRAIQEHESCIELTGEGHIGKIRLRQVTTDMAQAVSKAAMILLIMPSFAFGVTARKLAAHLKPGMKVYVCCGSTGGALEIAKIFHDSGKLQGVCVGEFSELPLGCFKTGPTSVRINTVVPYNEFSAFPAKDTEKLLPEIQEVFGDVRPLRDVLESALANGNIVCHGPVVMLNAAGTEGNPDNHHYRDGITPSVARVMDAVDTERIAVGKVLGYKILPIAESCVASGYCPKLLENTYLTFRTSQDFMTAPGPTTLHHRYMTEDIPYSALVVSVLGRVTGVPTPVTDAMITVCSALMGQDYWTEGRTADVLGVDGMDADAILRFLQEGYPELG